MFSKNTGRCRQYTSTRVGASRDYGPHHFGTRVCVFTVVGLALAIHPPTVSAVDPWCGAGPGPVAGPGKPWEAQVSVSTYSSVNTHNGNLLTAIPIVSWSGLGPEMNVMLYHNSANASSGYSIANVVGFNLGPGWSISYSDHLRLEQLPNSVTVVHADGTRDLYQRYQQTWSRPYAAADVLTQLDATTWRLTAKDQSYREFSPVVFAGDTIPRLARIVDATGNALVVSWTVVPTTRLLSVTDAANRPVNFVYGLSGPDQGRLLELQDPADADPNWHDRKWTFSYNPAGRLSEIEDAMQSDRPNDGGYLNLLEYDAVGRLTSVSDKCDSCSSDDKFGFTYSPVGHLVQVLDPTGDGGGHTQQLAVLCYDVSELDRRTRTFYTDRRGFDWEYNYPEGSQILVPNNAGTLAAISGPVSSFYDFDGSGNLLSFSDANFNEWIATYDARGNRLTLRDPQLHTRTWTYDGFNNVTSYSDAAGNMVRYYYDHAMDLTPQPTLLTRIVEPSDAANPPPNQPPGQEGGFPVTRLSYYLNPGGTCTALSSGGNLGCHGQLREVADPNRVRTVFEYDRWGQQAMYIEGPFDAQGATAASAAAAAARGGYSSGSTQTSCGHPSDNESSGGGGGEQDTDSNGNGTGSSCFIALLSAAGGALPPGASQVIPPWPDLPLPCYPPPIPDRAATYANEPGFEPDAEYTPKGQLKKLRLDIEGAGTRTHRRTYDVMGRPRTVDVESDEAGVSPITRTFTHTYNVAAGNYTRTGPDGGTTVAHLDSADRVVNLERYDSQQALLMSVGYIYKPNGYVESISYGNGTRVQYVYQNHRLFSIEHVRDPVTGERLLRLEYSYNNNDVPVQITEYGPGFPGDGAAALTSFQYDRRSRLIRESRVYSPAPNDPAKNYDLEYVYDKGGNRLRKIDHYNGKRVDYHYDVDPDVNPPQAVNPYGSFNNRLMWYEALNTVPEPDVSLTKTYYVYTYDATDQDRVGRTDGNVTRIITEYPQFGDWICAPNEKKYTAVRLGYAENGRTVTFAHQERWCHVPGSPSPCSANYAVTLPLEFRYDGARARYMKRPLDTSLNPHPTQATIWTDYDGDDTYGDFTVSGSTAASTDKYEPGLWQKLGSVASYLHGDMLGTLRNTTTATGAQGTGRVFTAFGEKIGLIPADRFGYVGAWGYQAHTEMPFLHVGHRYYDPASGRFLQRDPIGIEGGTNVFAYASSRASARIDPVGLVDQNWVPPWPELEWPPPERPDTRPVIPGLVLDVLPEWLDDPDVVDTVSDIAAVIGWLALPPFVKVPMWAKWALWCGRGATIGQRL